MNKPEKLKLLRNLKEDRLTGQVIIPLLEKMGFKNITLTHGPLEKGKGLWFYKENDFEEREYTGVQVKAVDIHGSAGKTSNAGEILTQAQQYHRLVIEGAPGAGKTTLAAGGYVQAGRRCAVEPMGPMQKTQKPL
jgi:hypothetical protein